MFPFRRAYRGLRSLFRKASCKEAWKGYAPPRANANNGLLRVKKTVLEDPINVLVNATQFGAITYELSDLPQASNYINLYEEFRIDRIVVSYKALTNQSSTAPLAGSNFCSMLGMIHTVIDTNDVAVPTTIQNMMNDSTYRGTRSSITHTRSFKPKFMNVVASGVANQQASGWLTTDGSGQSISHYGIKYGLQGGYSNIVGSGYISYRVQPQVTYYMSFRNPK